MTDNIDLAEIRLKIIRHQHIQISELRARLKAAPETDLTVRDIMNRTADRLLDVHRTMARELADMREKEV
jgi:hypothetical protein